MTLQDFQTKWNKKNETVYAPLDSKLNPNPIDMQIPTVNILLGGGLPRGKITQLIGEKSSGKTLFAQLAIAAVQKIGGTILFFDVEHTFDPKWFQLTGIDTSDEKLKIIRPQSQEQCFDMCDDALRTFEPDLIVIDSITALVPQAIMDSKMEDKDFMGLKARKNSDGLGKITQTNSKTAIILINQLRANIGNIYVTESLPGGYALKHLSSLILRTRRGAWLTDADTTIEDADQLLHLESDKTAKRIGYVMRIRTDWSKVAAPFQETELKIYFNGTVDPLSSIIQVAISRGIINNVSKGYYTLPDSDEKIHGIANLEDILRENAEMLEVIMERIQNE